MKKKNGKRETKKKKKKKKKKKSEIEGFTTSSRESACTGYVPEFFGYVPGNGDSSGRLAVCGLRLVLAAWKRGGPRPSR